MEWRYDRRPSPVRLDLSHGFCPRLSVLLDRRLSILHRTYSVKDMFEVEGVDMSPRLWMEWSNNTLNLLYYISVLEVFFISRDTYD